MGRLRDVSPSQGRNVSQPYHIPWNFFVFVTVYSCDTLYPPGVPRNCAIFSQHSDFKLALWRNQDRAEALLRVLIAALRAEIDALIARYAWVWTRSWVLFFVWALRDTSGRYMVDCTRAIFSQTVRTAAAYFTISLLRPSGEKKQTFSVVSLQLTVQLPCRNVFSSFILPLRACQKRSFDDVSTVGAGAERGVKSRQANRSPQSLRSTKIRAWLP